MRNVVRKLSVDIPMPARELNVSFGYQCNRTSYSSSSLVEEELDDPNTLGEGVLMTWHSELKTRSSSFSCLSGAALSANATLANTKICNGIIGDEILPSIDSPNSFRRLSSSPSLSRLDLEILDTEAKISKPRSAPARSESSSFLNAVDAQTAGGAAGEDRVQAVCSEENGWLFCGIYDGFNGRDAADFLAGTLYDSIACSLHNLEWRSKELQSSLSSEAEFFQRGVIDCLKDAIALAESKFLHMVEQEMEDRPDLVSVGSCVLVALLYMSDIYILNLGDSRAILATGVKEGKPLMAVQLTETHTVDNESEQMKVVADHPNDPRPIYNGRLKGKLKLTRALGVGYLKESKMNDMLMGILRIQNLCSPPYVYSEPFTISHRVSDNDHFIILGSDGLFDFFSNDEVVQLVHFFIQQNPSGDPAKHLVERLVQRAADSAGFSTEELLTVPVGRRRKYHDDVTVIVIILGNKQRTSTASTSL
ncbi:probable protein phosphatase 2C 39 [Punica granatum]|uniref:protein-serine/threonine phosphatase n=1 Tax=Punica granatum TaxID=22663 RepID=A0A218WWE0_PUNGR|nr:probable protein phosphatase 2C 39 [Punica granatum]XP_031401603.1 probable protein phosphatase 2C 39 [Punica granatum]OWM76302.1 hypothetical protein CDL15_Pgr009948 [Punica granatum]